MLSHVGWSFLLLEGEEKSILGAFNKFPDFFVQAFKIVVDS